MITTINIFLTILGIYFLIGLLFGLHYLPKGQPINEAVLPFIGKSSEIKGIVEKMEDWFILKINPADIKIESETSPIYDSNI